jgi:hypothetical protein
MIKMEEENIKNKHSLKDNIFYMFLAIGIFVFLFIVIYYLSRESLVFVINLSLVFISLSPIVGLFLCNNPDEDPYEMYSIFISFFLPSLILLISDMITIVFILTIETEILYRILLLVLYITFLIINVISLFYLLYVREKIRLYVLYRKNKFKKMVEKRKKGKSKKYIDYDPNWWRKGK